jgi:uncharacterized membrane protein HdeD (DUF308 family)
MKHIDWWSGASGSEHTQGAGVTGGSILAGLIVSGFPETLSWALGALVGIDLLFGGTALLAMAFAARNSGKASLG